MSSLLRLTLLGLCAASGVAIAVCVAISPPAANHHPEQGTSRAASERTVPSESALSAASVPALRQAVPAPMLIRSEPLLGDPNPTTDPRLIDPHATKMRRDAAGLEVPPSPSIAHPSAEHSAESGSDPWQGAGPIYAEPSPAITQQAKAPSRNDILKMITPEVKQQLQDLLQSDPNAALDPGGTPPAGSERPEAVNPPSAGHPAPSLAKPDAPKKGPTIKPRIAKAPGEGDDHLSIHIQDTDIREVLELLSEQGGWNILPSAAVHGTVTASLTNVDLDTALSAILRSTGYVTRRDAKCIYVGTPQDFQNMEKSLDRITTRIYRPNYVRAADVQALITPLLTQGVGAISVSTPSEVGIGADANKAGGDAFGGGDTILIKDYEGVLIQVDQVMAEIDRKPLQVSIEAMILSVKLDDTNKLGVDFQLLRNKSHIRLATGSPLSDLGQIDFSEGGLKFGFLDSTLGAFLDALQTMGETNVIATPQLMCLNKQRAEILIGSQLGYISSTITETSTAQNVQFLEVGTQLRLRPFISDDGQIRMEIHPELSTGTVQVQGQFTLPQKDLTQVTTNVMTRDGCTVVIGGLIREDLDQETTQVPFLGSLPAVGWLFRHRTDTKERHEILVLITPHIVCEPQASAAGSFAANASERHHDALAESMNPCGDRYLSRKYFNLAQHAWKAGDRASALRYVDLSARFDPSNHAADELRATIESNELHASLSTAQPALALPTGLDGPAIEPWVLEGLEQPTGQPAERSTVPAAPSQPPREPGVPGRAISIQRPEKLQ